MISRASSNADSSTLSFSANLLARPHSRASFPEIPRPVKMRSRALFSPMIFASLIVPPSIRGTPNLLQKTPKTASLWVTFCDGIIFFFFLCL